MYLTYKTTVPFKFSYVIDEYMRQICVKSGLVQSDECAKLTSNEVRQSFDEFLISQEKSSEAIDQSFLTKMKGIDYTKIQQYLNLLEQKKIRKILRSQGSKNRDNVSSVQEGGSEAGFSDSRFQFNNVTQMSQNHLSGSKLGHHRISSSITDGLALLNTTKQSRSQRRETIVSQSYHLPQNLIQSNQSASFLNNKGTLSGVSKSKLSPSRNLAKTQAKTRENEQTGQLSSLNYDTPYSLFLDAKNHLSTTQHQTASPQDIKNCQTPGSSKEGPHTLLSNTKSMQSFGQFRQKWVSNPKVMDSVENLYQKVETKRTTNEVRESQRYHLSRQSNQSSIQNMKPPQNPIASPYKPSLVQQRSSAFVPSSSRLKQGTMSTLSLGLKSGNGSSPERSNHGPPKSLITIKTNSIEKKQIDSGQSGIELGDGRKSAQQPVTSSQTLIEKSKEVQRRAFNQSQQDLALKKPMIIQSPLKTGHTLIQSKRSPENQEKVFRNSMKEQAARQEIVNTTERVQQTIVQHFSMKIFQPGFSPNQPRTRNQQTSKPMTQSKTVNLKSKTNREPVRVSHAQPSEVMETLRKGSATPLQKSRTLKSETPGSATRKPTTVKQKKLQSPPLPRNEQLLDDEIPVEKEMDEKGFKDVMERNIQRIPKSQRFLSHKSREMKGISQKHQTPAMDGKQSEPITYQTFTTDQMNEADSGSISINQVILPRPKGAHSRKPSQRYQAASQRESTLSVTDEKNDTSQRPQACELRSPGASRLIVNPMFKTSAAKSFIDNKRNLRYDAPKDSDFSLKVNQNDVRKLKLYLQGNLNDLQDEDIIESSRDDEAIRVAMAKEKNLKYIMETQQQKKMHQLQSPVQVAGRGHQKSSSGKTEEISIEATATIFREAYKHVSLNLGISGPPKKLAQYLDSSKKDFNDEKLFSPGANGGKGKLKAQLTKGQEINQKLFSPENLEKGLKTPSSRRTGVDISNLSTKIKLTSLIGSNRKQQKQYLNEKVQIQRQDFGVNFGVAFGSKLQNRLSSKLVVKKEVHEESVLLSSHERSLVYQNQDLTMQPLPHEMAAGEQSDFSESDNDQHTYQLNTVSLPGHHKKSNSIFSNGNLIPVNSSDSKQMSRIGESPDPQGYVHHNTQSQPRKKTLDPSGEYRIDLHKFQQPQQIFSSHGGDIDHVPQTPRSTKTPNKTGSSGVASISKSNKGKLRSGEKGPRSPGSEPNSSVARLKLKERQHAAYDTLNRQLSKPVQ